VVHILESVFMTYWLTISEMLLSEMARATPIKSFSTSRVLSRFLAFLGKVAKLRKWLLFSSCSSVCLQLHCSDLFAIEFTRFYIQTRLD